ncbi:MAG: hypothetical protein IPF38_15625 [Burkholderiales bacterium]|nr:hypothetical protein [Burkholderiales bacterium]
MTAEAVLIELLERLAAVPGGAILVNTHELNQWPPDAWAALKKQQLLAKAHAAASAVCPGCERECMMPVHTPPATTGNAAAFIVCDNRSDINRVAVPLDRLTQWRCSVQAVCGFVAESAGIRNAVKPGSDTNLWEIGIATGKKRSQMLCLQVNGALALVAGGNALPLADFIGYANGVYSVDVLMVNQLVDSAATTDVRYTPSTAKREVGKHDTQAMYEGWRKAYRAMKRKYPGKSDVWCSKQIAKDTQINPLGRNASTIKKNMLA